MWHLACLPKSWWEFCIEYAVHVYNRTPVHRVKTTPHEMLDRMKPDISHLRVMGCAAYVFLHEDQQQNVLSPHAELMTFIGFTDGVKGWKFMRSKNTIFHATKAVFDESTFLHCPEGNHASILDCLILMSPVLRKRMIKFHPKILHHPLWSLIPYGVPVVLVPRCHMEGEVELILLPLQPTSSWIKEYNL